MPAFSINPLSSPSSPPSSVIGPKFVRQDGTTVDRRNVYLITFCTVVLTFMLFQPFTSSFSSSSSSSLSTATTTAASLSSSSSSFTSTNSIPKIVRISAHDHDATHPDFRRVLIYNRPPHPASTFIGAALSRAFKARGLSTARCFTSEQWNAMSVRTAINRHQVDLYNCRLKLTKARYRDVLAMRGHNVTFMTSTADPLITLLTSYFSQQSITLSPKSSQLHSITKPSDIQLHTQSFRTFINNYDVGSLYNFHGADEDFPLTSCPTRYEQLASLRRVVARYEIVIDVDKPEESANLVEIVTGIRPHFTQLSQHPHLLHGFYDTPLVRALVNDVNVTERICGLQLVHQLLTQQFNLIKDRLLQNRCFDEDKGTFRLCDFMPLTKENIRERNREESFTVKDELAEQLKREIMKNQV